MKQSSINTSHEKLYPEDPSNATGSVVSFERASSSPQDLRVEGRLEFDGLGLGL